jgi:ABC-type Fe3+ transport system permease subunit
LAGVVAGMLFVSAPYAVNAAQIGFEAVDPRLEKLARTLGMGPWGILIYVTLPLAWRSIMTGLTLTYARAISEFAPVAILAYYPMTAPVKIYELFLQNGLDESSAMALLLLVVSLALFILFRSIARRRTVFAGAGGDDGCRHGNRGGLPDPGSVLVAQHRPDARRRRDPGAAWPEWRRQVGLPRNDRGISPPAGRTP